MKDDDAGGRGKWRFLDDALFVNKNLKFTQFVNFK